MSSTAENSLRFRLGEPVLDSAARRRKAIKDAENLSKRPKPASEVIAHAENTRLQSQELTRQSRVRVLSASAVIAVFSLLGGYEHNLKPPY